MFLHTLSAQKSILSDSIHEFPKIERDMMTTHSWSAEYNINVKRLDVQHRMLVKLVDNLHDAWVARIDKTVLKDLLVELLEFSQMHFSFEEQLMKKYDFPDAADHQKQHRILLRRLNELVTLASSEQPPTSYIAYDIVTDWALAHISDQDNILGRFLNSKGIY
jgi:hemerythrin